MEDRPVEKADLISRAAACNAISKMIHECRENGEDAVADGMILARRYGIKQMPTIDAIPVEWLIDRANDPERAPLYRRYVQMLYEEWQKEQEAKT